MSASGRVFRFALLAESTARTATVLCDAAPTFATDSPRVAAFLRGFPQVTVRHLAARPEDAAVGQAVLQYVSREHGTWYVSVKGGLPETLRDATLTRRLNEEFTLRRAIVPLRNQATLLEFFEDMDWSRDALEAPFFTYWEMGSGKTLATLLATLGSPKPPRSVVIVCSNTLVGHWTDTVMRVHMAAPRDADSGTVTATVVRVVGVTYFKTHAQDVMRGVDVAIVDECQEFRSFTRDQRLAVQELQRAKSLFLLSGTPLVNSPQDLMGLLALMGEHIHDVSTNTASWTTRDGKTVTVEAPAWAWPTRAVRRVFDKNVSFYVPRLHASVDFQAMFPKVERHRVDVPLSVPQTLKYLAVRGVLTAPAPPGWTGSTRALTFKSPTGNFYNNRQVEACNEPDVLTDVVPKAEWLVQHLSAPAQRARDLPMVVHSRFIHKGTRLLAKALHDNTATRDLVTAEIIGDVEARARDDIIADFNGGKVGVLFISKAASTGVSLRGARSFVIEEAFPNVSSEEQTVGRVIRADSHPEGHAATVRVFTLTATFPAALKRGTAPLNALIPQDRVHDVGEWFREEAETLWPRAAPTLQRLLTTPTAWCRWMVAVVRAGAAEEGWHTVNEQFEARNQEKAAALGVYLRLLRDCSIDMPIGSMRVAPPSKYTAMSDAARLVACKRALRERLRRTRPSWVTADARWGLCVNAALRKVLADAPGAWLDMKPALLAQDGEFVTSLDQALRTRVDEERSRVQAKAREQAAKQQRAIDRARKAEARRTAERARQAAREAREAEWAKRRAGGSGKARQAGNGGGSGSRTQGGKKKRGRGHGAGSSPSRATHKKARSVHGGHRPHTTSSHVIALTIMKR